MKRRTFLAGSAVVPAWFAWAPAFAADYPDRPIQVIVPYAAGGADGETAEGEFADVELGLAHGAEEDFLG